MNKICLRCGEEKNINEFSILKKGKLGRHPNCKKCRRYYQNNRYKEGLVKKIPYNYSKQLKTYGLTIDNYNEMCDIQKGKCLICKQENVLIVDHCHKSGKVRGLLCQKCNKGIGHFQDNILFFQNAINYLTVQDQILNVDMENSLQNYETSV